mgnify:CR=1 FL=1
MTQIALGGLLRVAEVDNQLLLPVGGQEEPDG